MTDLLDVISLPQSVCFACGAARSGVIGSCPSCQRRPETVDQLRQAISRSGYDSTAATARKSEDSRFDNPVYRAVKQRSVEHSLSDKQLQELLGFASDRETSRTANKPKAVLAGSASTRRAEPRRWLANTLDGNPFFVLGASSTDSIDRLPTRAVANTVDGESWTVSSASLLDPAKRLQVEVHWLGDLGVEESRALINGETSPGTLSPLARLNCLHWRFVRSDDVDSIKLAQSVRDLESAFEAIDADALFSQLNDSRRRAGVVDVASVSDVVSALILRLDGIVSSLVSSLDTLPTDRLLDAYLDFCPPAGGAPGKIVQALVAHYWRHAGPVLLAEGDKVVALCRRCTSIVQQGDAVAEAFISRLASLLTLQKRLSQPLRCAPQRLAELRTSRRLMRSAMSDLLEAAESVGSEALADGVAGLQHTFFDGD